VDDAKGNAEALRKFKDLGLKIEENENAT